MATLVSISQVSEKAVCNQPTVFTVTVDNTGSSSLTLSSLQVYGQNKSATVAQPQFLTPNVAVGAGNPTITAAGAVTYAFTVIFNAPSTPGPSPAAPTDPAGGSAGVFVAQPAHSNHTLQAQCQTSDGSVASTTLAVPVLSAVAPFPVPQGGAAQFGQGGNSNLIAVLA